MKRSTNIIRLDQYTQRHVQLSASPFRYPGGKGFLTGYLATLAAALDEGERAYVEPFCGGAGAAMNLLMDEAFSCVHLNDFDPRIFSAWVAITSETERFLERLASVPINIETWWACRKLVENPAPGYDFETGFATYYLNRTSTGGIIMGSGPIGGYKQEGKWRLDARFYRESMAKRITQIGAWRDRIFLTNLPALEFLHSQKEQRDQARTFYFVDPPYIEAGSRLYLNAMTLPLHRSLSSLLKSGAFRHWVLTYDDNPIVRRMYSDCQIAELEVRYSLRNTRRAREVLISAA